MKGLIILAVVLSIVFLVAAVIFMATADTRADVRRRDVKRWKRQALYADERIHEIEKHVDQWWDETSILAQTVREEIRTYREDQRKKESE